MLRNAVRAEDSIWPWPATTAPRMDLYRLRKATLYADIIEAGDISVETVDDFRAGEWAALALIAKGKPPSPETCGLIRKLLRERATWRERLRCENGKATRRESH
jgi:hypothetical protein